MVAPCSLRLWSNDVSRAIIRLLHALCASVFGASVFGAAASEGVSLDSGGSASLGSLGPVPALGGSGGSGSLGPVPTLLDSLGPVPVSGGSLTLTAWFSREIALQSPTGSFSVFNIFWNPADPIILAFHRAASPSRGRLSVLYTGKAQFVLRKGHKAIFL